VDGARCAPYEGIVERSRKPFKRGL
jgi:hypothetical protein